MRDRRVTGRGVGQRNHRRRVQEAIGRDVLRTDHVFHRQAALAHLDDPAAAAYLKEFIQFNNAMKLDSKGGCYSRPGGQVKLMLLITHDKGERWASVSQVFSQTDSPKAQCLQRSYRGVPTKVPPVLPFIVQLDFE